MRYLYGFLVLFLFIFAPFLKLSGVTIHLPYYVVASLAILGLWRFNKQRGLPKQPALVLMALILLLLYCLMISYINGTYDREFYLQILTGVVLVPAGLGVVTLYELLYQGKAKSTLLWHFFWAGALHALIMIVAFAFEPVSSFLYTYIPLSEKGIRFVEMGSRSPGLTSGGGDVLSGFHALLVIIGFYLLLTQWRNLFVSQRALVIIGMYALLASLSLAARTGYVIIFGLLLCLFVLLKWYTEERYRRGYLLKGFSAFLCLIVLVFLSFSALLNISGETRAYKRSAELLISYQESGSSEIRSVSALKEMYFIPSEGVQLIFGTGDFGRNEALGFLKSDIGYVRAINGLGITGFLIMYIPMLIIGASFLKNRRLEMYQVVLILCATSILAMNLKLLYFWGMRDIFKIFVVSMFGVYCFKNSDCLRFDQLRVTKQ